MQGIQSPVTEACPNLLNEANSEQFIIDDFQLNNGQHIKNLKLHDHFGEAQIRCAG